MENGMLGTRVVTQIGMVVNDVDKTAKAFADFFGIDKPQSIQSDGYEKSHAQVDGKPSEARAKLAFINVGENLEIELIEPDHQPSSWRNYLDAHGEGVHHLAFVVKDMDTIIARLEQNGMPLQQKGDYKGGRYAYVDTFGPLKMITELLENF